LVEAAYVPSPGDLIWINFSPHARREQGGRRPALALSKSGYNRKTGLVVCCPITSHAKGYAFEVKMPPASAESGGIAGVVLADHIKSMDWRERQAEYGGIAAPEVISEVKFTLAGLLEILDWRVQTRTPIV
jgi:mRNA interferase MazF